MLISSILLCPRPPLAVKQTKIVQRLNNIDRIAFNNAVQHSSVCAASETLTNCSVIALCDMYQTELRRIVDDLAPPVTITISSRLSTPWYDGECRACCRKVRALERHYRRTRFDTDRLACSTALLEKRELFASKEHHYWTTKLTACAGNSKLLWRCLNSVLSRDDFSSPCHSALTPQALADFFIENWPK